MRVSLCRCALGFALVSLGCASRSVDPVNIEERSAIADSIRAITAEFAQGVNALDVNRFAKYFTHPELTWAGDGRLMLISPDSLMAIYRSVYRGFRAMNFAWDTLRVSVLDHNTALLAGGGHFAVTDTAGRLTKQGVAVTYLFTRNRGHWELLHGHASHLVLVE